MVERLYRKKVVTRVRAQIGEDALQNLLIVRREVLRRHMRLDFDKLGKLVRKLPNRRHDIRKPCCDGVSRHGRILGLIRILNEKKAARLLDRLRAERPVRASARQNHGEAVVVLVRKRAEELIDGRPFPSWFVERESCNFVVC